MKQVWLDELLKIVPNRFVLLSALVKRVKTLEEQKKKDPLFLHDSDSEEIALDELKKGKLSLKEREEKGR